MNKETELYLIRRIEALISENADLRQAKRELERPITVAENFDIIRQKAQAFDVLKKFIRLKVNPVAMETKLIFEIPEIEINEALEELFEELLNG